VDQAVQVTYDWNSFATQVGSSLPPVLDSTQLTESRFQLARYLAATPLPLAAGQWAGLSTSPLTVRAGAPPGLASTGVPPRLEVIYRDPLTSNVTLVAGSFPPPGGLGRTLRIAVTTATAARFALHPGSVLRLAVNGASVPVIVTAIVRPRAPASAFWNVDAAAVAPSYNVPGPTAGSPPYWSGAVFADPGEFAAMQATFGLLPMQLTWEFPLGLGSLQADRVPDLEHALNHVQGAAVTMSGDLAGTTLPLMVHAELLTQLTAFALTDTAVEQVLSLLFVSLTVVGVAVLLLAARISAARRATEFETVQSRGASLRQLTGLTLRSSVLACVPAAPAGACLALPLTPGPAAGLSWWLGGLTVLAALLGLPIVVAWQYRKPAPALVAIPAVIVIGRLYPLIIRGLLRLSARSTGAYGFLALTRAARTSLAGAAPAFALVLALTVASFAGMVRDAVTRGEIAASWQLTGADAVVDAGGTPAIVTPAVQRAVVALPGVRRTAIAWVMAWYVPDGQVVTAVAVDPGSYAAYTAGVPYPPAPLARLGSAAGVTTVLASPSAAALIGSGVSELTSAFAMGPLRVRVAGTVGATPAATGTGPFVIMPLEHIAGQTGPPATNLLLVTGTGFSHSALAALVSTDVPGAAIRFRSAVLDELVGSPLQAAADLIMRLSVAVAAGFGLAILLLGLALGSADRDLTLARLTTMGLEQGRLIRLVLWETLLAVIAAVVAGVACALALPALTSPALDLSVFTGSSTPVPIAPDLVALAVPAAGLAVLTAVAVVAETRLLRRRDVPGLLRIGG
jgi:putative ABC transport system permease protein